MGNVAPSDRSPLCPVEMQTREKPTQLMAQLLAVWPQVQEALKAGHTLRLIHQRLNLVGVPISYKLLSLYRGRIERRKKTPAASVSPNIVVLASRENHTPPGFDPLANLDAQERKRRAAWQYPSGLPDINKLAK
jgi:hypothetical protein